MKVYVVMVCDRHTDPEPRLFTNAGKAVDFAKAEALRFAGGDDLRVLQYDAEGWLYNAEVGAEGDSVWVVEKELDA